VQIIKRFQQMYPEERVALAAMRLQGMSLLAIRSILGRIPADAVVVRCPSNFCIDPVNSCSGVNVERTHL
jgi:hypothetical protein